MFTRPVLGLALAAGLTLLLAVTSMASPGPSTTAKSCGISRHEMTRLGATYVTSISVTRTTCSHGKSVVRAFQRCRKARGGHGRCHHAVLGYSCSERRGYEHGEFSSRVRCHKGRRHVNFTYTQFT